MHRLTCAAALTATLIFCVNASAEPYPSRPITLIVPFGAGGPTDTIARIFADRMGTALGGTIVVENIGGAAGSLGVGRAAHAPPDGYTLSIGHWGTHAVNSLIYPLKYDLLTDFTPVSLLASNPYLILSKKTLPANSLKDLIAWMKSNRATASDNGVGSAAQLIGTYFSKVTGAPIQFVPYRGGIGESMKDLVSGVIDVMFDQAATSLPQVRAGTIKAYAVTAAKRLAAAPDIPTVDEAGLPDFHLSAWHGLWVPKGTSPEIVAKLNQAVSQALADPIVRERLAKLGQDIPTSEQQTGAALAAQQRAEIERWRPMIHTVNKDMH